jgi:hypothetical protein
MKNISADLDFEPLKPEDNVSDINKKQLELLGKKESVNHPSHYNQGKIEVIDYIEDLGMGEDFCAGNAIKYISRYKYKENPLEDLKKARWYIDRIIQKHEKI